MSLLRRQRPALLVLEDGSVYRGSAFAGNGEAMGEVVFNTGMTGYQEIITDPSYKEQIVTMTYPLIGNYGINEEDMESGSIHLEGLVVKEYQAFPSNWRSRKSLKTFLEERGKLGIEGIDTRALTRRIRIAGAMRGIISTERLDEGALLARVREYPGMVGRDLVGSVTCSKPYLWRDDAPQPIIDTLTTVYNTKGSENPPYSPFAKGEKIISPPLEKGERIKFPPLVKGGLGGFAGGKEDLPRKLRVVVLDCGVKYNILRHLEKRGCEVLVLPATATTKEVCALSPDGLLLSNGPGDPATLTYVVDMVRDILGSVPIFGICLGHQILGQALGGETAKLKFGHHGINQPVKNRHTGRIEITSQNHGFVVVPETLTGDQDKTYDNLNDHTSEGMEDKPLMAFSVQYHPEAAPGPHDVNYLFDDFISLMIQQKGGPR